MSRARPMRPTYRRRGVTLIEMIIVISVLGLVGAMAMPRVRQAQRRAQLRAARDVVANYLNSARRSALTRSSNTQFVLAGNVVSVTMSNANGVGTTTILPGYDLYDQNKATISPSTTLTFDKRGLMRAGTATVKLVLTNDVAQRDSVCISGAGLVLRGSCR